MLLPAPFLLPTQGQPSPEGAMAIGVGGSLHIPGWRSGGIGDTVPPTNLCQQEAMTSPTPDPAAWWEVAMAPSSSPRLKGAQLGRASHQAPAPVMVAPDTGPCPGHSPSPHHRPAEVSPPWSSASDGALHTRRAGGKAGSSGGGSKGAGTETGGELGQQHRAKGSPQVRGGCLSMQLWGWPLGGRSRL